MKRIKRLTGQVVAVIIMSPLLTAYYVVLASEKIDDFMRRAKWPDSLLNTAERIDLWSRR